jgi:hypothetical protein
VKRQNDARTAFLVNGVVFQPPTVPVLLQILSGAKKASDLLPSGSIYGLEPNKSVELTIPGGALGGPVSVTSLPDLLFFDIALKHPSAFDPFDFDTLAPRSPARTCVLRGPQRRECVVQLCGSCRSRRREHR